MENYLINQLSRKVKGTKLEKELENFYLDLRTEVDNQIGKKQVGRKYFWRIKIKASYTVVKGYVRKCLKDADLQSIQIYREAVDMFDKWNIADARKGINCNPLYKEEICEFFIKTKNKPVKALTLITRRAERDYGKPILTPDEKTQMLINRNCERYRVPENHVEMIREFSQDELIFPILTNGRFRSLINNTRNDDLNIVSDYCKKTIKNIIFGLVNTKMRNKFKRIRTVEELISYEYYVYNRIYNNDLCVRDVYIYEQLFDEFFKLKR